jgi:hypothetical protein
MVGPRRGVLVLTFTRGKAEHKRGRSGHANGWRMENEKNPDRSNQRPPRRARDHLSRTRLVMGLLLIVALAVFVELANRFVHENPELFRQGFGQ